MAIYLPSIYHLIHGEGSWTRKYGATQKDGGMVTSGIGKYVYPYKSRK